MGMILQMNVLKRRDGLYAGAFFSFLSNPFANIVSCIYLLKAFIVTQKDVGDAKAKSTNNTLHHY